MNMRPVHSQLPLAAVAAGAVAVLAVTSLDLSATQGRAGSQTQTQGQGQTQGQAQGRAAGAAPPPTQRDQRQADRQARDVERLQQQIGTGSISGYVTVDGASSPVRRARINLTGPEVRPGRSTVTDDKGYYIVPNLPPGRFTINVSKPGFVNIAYGAKKPGRPGTAIQLADAQKLERANVSLPKGAVVTGIVIDEFGEPSPRTQVRVMRFVTRTGEKTLEMGDQAQTDDRGIYRVWGLQPGEYLVSAVPRNQNPGEGLAILAETVESLLQGRGGGPGRGALPLNAGRGLQRIEDAAVRQQELARQTEQQQQAVAYAPVYYPGTTSSTSATPITLNVGEERGGVDFQLQLVQTSTVSGTITSPDGVIPQGTQISLLPQTGGPSVPGLGTNSSRSSADGKFSFANVTPGQYTVMARGVIRPVGNANPANPNDPQAAAAFGRGRGGQGGQGPGGRGGLQQVLWAAADVTVNGQSTSEVSLHLQAGMTVSGRLAFEGMTATPPTDLTRARVSLMTRGQQTFDSGALPPAQVDASGNFKIIGVPPGRYVLTGNVPAAAQGGAAAGGVAGGGGRGGRGGGGGTGPIGQGNGGWTLKSAVVNGRDTLDFPFELRPNEEIAGALLTFTDASQEVSGTLQDPTGRPTSEFTIIVFAADRQFWTPQSRRIVSTRPDTSGKFTVRTLPPGDYRVTAVTDVEQGEWFDPAFLQQLVGVSVPFSLGQGQKHTQDLRVAGGGH
jgi:hypothetical protein